VETGVSACGGSNNQWWTFHHDERNTARYGVDARPPGSPENLVASRNAAGGPVNVSWTQPGDDWLCGSPARYRVIISDSPIDNPDDGDVIVYAAAGGAGQRVSRTLIRPSARTARHVAVLYRDDAKNWGLLRSARITGPSSP
jgi:hypothetical protein